MSTSWQVVLGISGHRTSHLIGWASRLVRPGDEVVIVHAYPPIPYAATDWQLPIDSDPVVREVTKRHIRDAVTRLRTQRPDVKVREEIRTEPAARVLLAAARQAGLVMVGVPHCDRSRAVLHRLVAEAPCPVLVIGAAQPLASGPVTALLRGRDSDDAVLEAAFTAAAGRRSEVIAVKPWHRPLDGSQFYAETSEQKLLDAQLARWSERFDGLPVVAELLTSDSGATLTAHVQQAELLVTARPAGFAELDLALKELIDTRDLPTLVVPERLRPAEPLAAGRTGHRPKWLLPAQV